MARNPFRRRAVPQDVPDDVAPGSPEWLSRQMGEVEPPAPKKHWWSMYGRGTATLIVNGPGSTGGSNFGGGF